MARNSSAATLLGEVTSSGQLEYLEIELLHDTNMLHRLRFSVGGFI